MSGRVLSFLLALCLTEIHAGIEVGFGNIHQDTVGTMTILTSGTVPSWINGSFLRQSCGAYGETGSTLDIVNKVTHIFDCIEMGTSFHIEGGQITYYNRFYETSRVEVWKHFDMNMNESKVFWHTTYSDFDVEAKAIADDLSRQWDLIRDVPHVTWWLIEDKVLGKTETTRHVQVDPHVVINAQGRHQFNDNFFGYEGVSVVDETPHEVQEADGTLWANHMGYKKQGDIVQQWRNVFKIVDNQRMSVATIDYPDINLTLCEGSNYSRIEDRQGYMHSFGLTENYVILPETSYLFNPCNQWPNWDPTVGLYTQQFDWEGGYPGIIRVIRKSDGVEMAAIETEPFFVTHQLNSYEDGNFIYADMLVYDDSKIYTYYPLVENLIAGELFESHVYRFTINMTDWSVQGQDIVNPAPFEMSNINPDYLTKKYRYSYMISGIYINNAPQILVKVDVDTGNTIEYRASAGLYLQEPWFVPKPDSQDEDDGVVLVQGIDTINEKGFLMIFDATDLSLLTHVTGSDLALFGIHNKFYPSHVGRMATGDEPTQPPNGAANQLRLSAITVGVAVFLASFASL